MIEFADFTKEQQKIVGQIVRRARAMLIEAGAQEDPRTVDPLTIEMDISAVHAKCPLKLEALLAADDFNFAHDIGGIRRHINRETGELEDCFVPRFAA